MISHSNVISWISVSIMELRVPLVSSFSHHIVHLAHIISSLGVITLYFWNDLYLRLENQTEERLLTGDQLNKSHIIYTENSSTIKAPIILLHLCSSITLEVLSQMNLFLNLTIDSGTQRKPPNQCTYKHSEFWAPVIYHSPFV